MADLFHFKLNMEGSSYPLVGWEVDAKRRSEEMDWMAPNCRRDQANALSLFEKYIAFFVTLHLSGSNVVNWKFISLIFHIIQYLLNLKNQVCLPSGDLHVASAGPTYYYYYKHICLQFIRFFNLFAIICFYHSDCRLNPQDS